MEAEVERLLGPLMDGLEQVHATGFLHRDIKPTNIIVDAEDLPTLIDFGAARAAMVGRTQTLTAMFTPGYAPIEQFTSRKQGVAPAAARPRRAMELRHIRKKPELAFH